MNIDNLFEIWRHTNKVIKVRVYGTSMLPFLKGGEIVSICLLYHPSSLKPGELIAFKRDKCLIVHRLIKKKKINGIWWFCQKGDNLPGWNWIKGDEIIGRVEAINTGSKPLLMNKWPWNLVNWILGYLNLLWIDLSENAKCLTNTRSFGTYYPYLLSIYKGFSIILQRIFQLITGICIM